AAGRRRIFVWDDGTPMRFYIRPGVAKMRLAPLLLAGGAWLCRTQEPDAVHLVQPGEIAPDGAVSTEYVTAPSAPRGRVAFTAEEDAALLRAVRERSGARTGGRTLWKELERAGVTRHSWQAMRERYRRHLRPREPPVAEEPARPLGIFEAANREFESSESDSNCSDTPEEFPTQDGEGGPPAEAAPGPKNGLEDRTLPTPEPQRESRPTGTCSNFSRVEEAVKTLRHFMEKFDMDLLAVTQALLKNSGEVEATSHFLQTGQRLDGCPVWSREDDLELQKDEEHFSSKLIAKFGAENVAKRVAFRKS
ncbi:TE2IP protein, partial [Penelope pileata]|nr:TE2IP protein [Penelope pileata]